MITLKQYLYEMAMHRGAYAEAIKRLGDSILIGFEFEVFVPTSSEYFIEAAGVKPRAVPVRVLNTMHEFETLFNVSKQQRRGIEHDYQQWKTAKEDEYVEDHWRDHIDADDEDDKFAERAARQAALSEYSADKYRDSWDDWFSETFKTAHDFISEYSLEPMYGWGDDEDEVLETEPSSQGYHETWETSAKKIAEDLGELLSTKVQIRGGDSSKWNLVHDSSIKDSAGTDYESGQNGIGVEIISPPTPYNKAMSDLATVLKFIDRHFETNETTGLHVNISMPPINKIDPLKLILFMGDKHTLKQFGRLTNAFTKSQLQVAIDGIELTGELPRTADQIKVAAQQALDTTTKNYSVNLKKLKQGYLEFRAIGGENYHRRITDINDAIGRWVLATEIASTPDMARKEYLKKLYQLRDKTSLAGGK